MYNKILIFSDKIYYIYFVLIYLIKHKNWTISLSLSLIENSYQLYNLIRICIYKCIIE